MIGKDLVLLFCYLFCSCLYGLMIFLVTCLDTFFHIFCISNVLFFWWLSWVSYWPFYVKAVCFKLVAPSIIYKHSILYPPTHSHFMSLILDFTFSILFWIDRFLLSYFYYIYLLIHITSVKSDLHVIITVVEYSVFMFTFSIEIFTFICFHLIV